MECTSTKVKWSIPLITIIEVSQTQADCTADVNKPNPGGDGGASVCS
jgi:hypothetical protein